MKHKLNFYENMTDDDCFNMLAIDGGIAFNSVSNDFERHSQHYSSYKVLQRVEDFVKDVEKTDKQPYRVAFINGRHQYIPNNKRLIFWMGNLAGMWNEVSIKDRYYSPRITLFILSVQRMVESAGKAGDIFIPTEMWRTKDLNKLYRFLRKLLKGKKYKALSHDTKKAISRRFYDALDYVLAHLRNLSKMLVVCVDLHIHDTYKHAINDKEIRRLRERLLDVLRKDNKFSCIEGYICKVEEGIDRGPHLHLMLLINGQINKNASFWATEVGEVWTHHVTLQRGYYHNCHMGNTKYAWRDVGMVRYNDRESIRKMFKAISYMVKPDQYFYSKSQIKANMFTKGRMPELRKDKRGRPRKYADIDFQMADEIHQLFVKRKVSV